MSIFVRERSTLRHWDNWMVKEEFCGSSFPWCGRLFWPWNIPLIEFCKEMERRIRARMIWKLFDITSPSIHVFSFQTRLNELSSRTKSLPHLQKPCLLRPDDGPLDSYPGQIFATCPMPFFFIITSFHPRINREMPRVCLFTYRLTDTWEPLIFQ